MISASNGTVMAHGTGSTLQVEFMEICKCLVEKGVFEDVAEMVDHLMFATASEEEQKEVLSGMLDDAIRFLEELKDD